MSSMASRSSHASITPKNAVTKRLSNIVAATGGSRSTLVEEFVDEESTDMGVTFKMRSDRDPQQERIALDAVAQQRHSVRRGGSTIAEGEEEGVVTTSDELRAKSNEVFSGVLPGMLYNKTFSYGERPHDSYPSPPTSPPPTPSSRPSLSPTHLPLPPISRPPLDTWSRCMGNCFRLCSMPLLGSPDFRAGVAAASRGETFVPSKSSGSATSSGGGPIGGGPPGSTKAGPSGGTHKKRPLPPGYGPGAPRRLSYALAPNDRVNHEDVEELGRMYAKMAGTAPDEERAGSPELVGADPVVLAGR